MTHPEPAAVAALRAALIECDEPSAYRAAIIDAFERNLSRLPVPANLPDQQDARRYRLLRRGQHWSVIDGIGDTLRAEVLDAAIDRLASPTNPLAAPDDLVAAAKAVAFSNGFDVALPDKMEALRVAVRAAEKECRDPVGAGAAELPEPARCSNCDDTGDVHSIDGEWRGICHCKAGDELRNRRAAPL